MGEGASVMTEEPTSGTTRLRKSGVGVVVGGLLLAVGVAVFPFWLAALVVFLIGIGGLVYGTRFGATQGAVGVLAIGAIALLEAIPGVGLGIEPLFLAVLAVAFGVFDILAGALLGRIRRRG